MQTDRDAEDFFEIHPQEACVAEFAKQRNPPQVRLTLQEGEAAPAAFRPRHSHRH